MRFVDLPISQIISDYQSGMTLTQVASKHNTSKRTILRRLISIDQTRRTNSDANRSYSLNPSFFEKIDTEQKAYWLGFLLADGNIAYNGRKRKGRALRIALQKRDVTHLIKLKEAIGSSHPIKPDKKRKCVWLCISSRPLTEPLEIAGWHDFKQSGDTRIFQSVPHILIPHVIRGMIDGDGCITKDRRRYILGFTDLHKSIVIWFDEAIHRLGFPSKSKPYNAKKHKNWNILYSHKRVPELLRFLYQDSSIFLDRKMIRATRSFSGVHPRTEW
jgi:hypothetical protein